MLIMSVQINKSSICTVTRQHNLFEKKKSKGFDDLFIYSYCY